MDFLSQFNEATGHRLAAFLEAPDRPANTMGYFECAGFLFVIACSPEPVNPSEWIPVIYNSGSENDEADIDDIKVALGDLMALYNEVNRQVRESDVSLLPGCDIRPEPLANLEADTPISQWANGFIQGYDWLEELWSEYIPETLDEEFGSLMLVLSFFANKQIAESFVEDGAKEGLTLERMAASMQDLFVDAMQDFARLSFTVQLVIQKHYGETQQPASSEKIGRNEPCPCGSGIKYKKCCA